MPEYDLARLNGRLAAMHLSKTLKENFSNLKQKDFTVSNVSQIVASYLERGKTQRWIQSYQVGEVKQLWETWSLKQKAKWVLYNKTPILKNFSDDYRKLVSEHNNIIYIIHELEMPDPSVIKASNGTTYEHLYSFKSVDLPPHLIPDPKTITITDIKFKPFQAVDFISLNVEIKEPTDEAEERV